MQELRLKSPDDIQRIRVAGRIIAEIYSALYGMSLGGLSTWEIDRFVEDMIRKKKARASFKTVKNYGHATCISVNEEIVHGIPSKKKIIQKGDIVKIDIGVAKNGYFADRCDTFAVEPVPAKAQRLIAVTQESLRRAISVSRTGGRLGDIGHAIQRYAERHGYSVVRDLTGHGVGFAVHELPTVLHYGKKGAGNPLLAGMVIAIEPMINEGSEEIIALGDGWTIATADGTLSAQFEHTVAITPEGPRILTE